jgi:hypothetical protein
MVKNTGGSVFAFSNRIQLELTDVRFLPVTPGIIPDALLEAFTFWAVGNLLQVGDDVFAADHDDDADDAVVMDDPDHHIGDDTPHDGNDNDDDDDKEIRV